MSSNVRRGGEPEDAERLLDLKLKKIKRDTLRDKKRIQAMDAHLHDTNVISRVKKLISLPPDHVKEVGCFSNPMRGHKDVIIFSRVTGHPNLADNNIWFDNHECWVCDKHNKMSVTVSMADKIVDQQF